MSFRRRNVKPEDACGVSLRATHSEVIMEMTVESLIEAL
jgi:hypothetical protein